MERIAVSSAALSLRAEKPLTPAMVSALWELSAVIDEERIPAEVPNSVWLTIPTRRLRGPGAQSDNTWLKECLDRMTGLKLTGQFRGEEWGAVLLAEWHMIEGGSQVRILVPPAGIHALRGPGNFVKIETTAAHRLPPHARRLYILLADRKNQTKNHYAQWSVDNLRGLMGVADKRSYDRWSDLRARVLDPAVKAINDFGTVDVTMTLKKSGRSVSAVRFDWKWKDPHEATKTVSENERHSKAQHKEQDTSDAPPMIEDEPQGDQEMDWWGRLTNAEREGWADHVGRIGDKGLGPEPRPERIIRQLAFEAYRKGHRLLI